VLVDHKKATLQGHHYQLQTAFEIKVQGEINQYLGIKFDRHTNSNIYQSQPQLIDIILVDMKL
jgi:hypothetical protein